MLAGRTALVTGAAHGIGAATAGLLTAHGARVLLADVDADGLAATAAALPAGSTAVLAGDLTAPGHPAEIVAAAVDLGAGELDIVVNNAGYNLNARLVEMSDEAWQAMLDIHVTAPFAVLRAAGPHLIAAAERDRAAGREVFRKVVSITSIALMGSAYQANYAAAKAAVVGLTKSLAKEWGPHLVNVNAVGFGSVDTRLTRPRDADNVLHLPGGDVRLGLSEKVMTVAAQSIPSGRVASPQEAAGAVFLLCTPWSDWITGQVLLATGGQVYGMSG
ncbi:SDR family oxidoreductase [Nakamurella sp. YIM 132087]|uniref:SDR family oxidoreductase n=1 Tax=Nakamurella alba TaxID=2665158 RepID=A0A7K1FP80_9ACTN|nr:SDR family oxidoreductase [Nakamurella alba]